MRRRTVNTLTIKITNEGVLVNLKGLSFAGIIKNLPHSKLAKVAHVHGVGWLVLEIDSLEVSDVICVCAEMKLISPYQKIIVSPIGKFDQEQLMKNVDDTIRRWANQRQ